MARGVEQLSEGIILHCLPYGEADMVVTMLLKESGSLTLFARGGRASRRSRFGVCLQPFTRVMAGYRVRSSSSMASLVTMEPVTIYSGIPRSLPAIAAASWGAELCRYTALQAGEAGELYGLLLSYLDRLDLYWDETHWADVVAFGLGALDVLGFRQEFWGCCGCGADPCSWLGAGWSGGEPGSEPGHPGPCTRGVLISIHDGGLICPVCRQDRQVAGVIHGDGDTLAILQGLALAGRRGQFGAGALQGLVSAHRSGLRQAKEITMKLIDSVVGRKLRSYDFLEEILGPVPLHPRD